jgi:hypothetical protein
MSDESSSAKADKPSIDEILRSIRRIIDDDEPRSSTQTSEVVASVEQLKSLIASPDAVNRALGSPSVEAQDKQSLLHFSFYSKALCVAVMLVSLWGILILHAATPSAMTLAEIGLSACIGFAARVLIEGPPWDEDGPSVRSLIERFF